MAFTYDQWKPAGPRKKRKARQANQPQSTFDLCQTLEAELKLDSVDWLTQTQCRSVSARP